LGTEQHSNSPDLATSQIGGAAESPEIMYRIFEFAPDAMLVVDQDGRIAKANAQAEKMFGYTRAELIGQLIEILVPRRLSAGHISHRSGYIAAPRTRTMGAGLELYGLRKDGTEFPVDIMLSPMTTGEGHLVLGVVRDVTERKRIETEALEAREMYLKEVHHRIKNNLQVISSLLFLQSTYTADKNVIKLLQESQGRVKSIALIHEKLYRTPELGKIDLPEYIRDLVTDLQHTYGVGKDSVSIDVKVDNVSIEIDTAIPCGLIVNELVSNALKYAFPNGGHGKLMVHIEQTGPKRFVLMVEDDGVGMPENFDVKKSRSLGLKLVGDLARQLDGRVETRVDHGTKFRIEFTELMYKERS
jgi:PAS domain S-box-containing protein